MRASRLKHALLWVLVMLMVVSAAVQAAPPQQSPVVHVVRWGETLTAIAARYGTTVQAIAQANGLANPDYIYAGQRLLVSGEGQTAAPPASSASTVHVVRAGETLSSIAYRYGTTVSSIVQANSIHNPSYIYTGQRLIIPGRRASASSSATRYYTVQRGDTLAAIAYRYGTTIWAIVQANNLPNPSLIYTGQQLAIPGTAPPSNPASAPTVAPTDAPSALPPEASPTPTPVPPVPAVKPLHMNSPEYGMQVFLWWRPETADRDLQKAKEAGFTWVKQIIAWVDVEGRGKGQFDWDRTDRLVNQVNQYGLDLVARLDSAPGWAGGSPAVGPMSNYQDFADFCYALASRYKGRIRAYQIWNEPNLNVAGRSEWGGHPPDPAGYTELLKQAYQAIKRADPNAMVISAGLSPTSRWDDQAMPDVEFLKAMYAAGAKPYFDVLGVHGAGYKVPPETDPWEVARDPVLNNNDPTTDEFRKRVYCFRRVEDMRQVMVENGDADKQIALLEFGWTTDPVHPEYAWFAVSEQEQADYLVRAYQYAKAHWSPWIGVMSLIYMPNPDWTEDKEEYWWSIARPSYPNFTPRPAYTALKDMAK